MANTTRVSRGGRIVIPADLRRELGLEIGEEVFLTVRNGELRVSTRRARVRQAQAMVRRHVKRAPQRSLVDEFIAERREQAERE
jgi:AbrB family looped-hinge helix DNA binding protein